jgi:hypothetical protein
VRTQLTSHVDLVPLLMTLVSGSNEWRTQPQYAHLAGRANLAAMLSNPNAKGRDYIIHTSDEDIPEQTFPTGNNYDDVKTIMNSSGNPPSHVIGYRTKTTKLGVYSYFAPGTIEIQKNGQQAELYNYQQDGIDEVINRAPGAAAPDLALYAAMYDALFNPTGGAVATELRQPLPNRLKQVQKRAFNTYLAYEAQVQGTSSATQASSSSTEAFASEVYVPFAQK